MKDLKNTMLTILTAITLSLGAWVFQINAEVAVLKNNSVRYEKVIEKNTTALHGLELALKEFTTKIGK